jgi:hypothetical protein
MANKKRKASAAARPAVDLPKRVRTSKESITGEADIPETGVNAIATAGGRQKKTSTGEQPQYYFTRTMLIAAQKPRTTMLRPSPKSSEAEADHPRNPRKKKNRRFQRKLQLRR